MSDTTKFDLCHMTLDLDFRSGLPTSGEVMRWFGVMEAGWVYSGEPTKPHAKLHSGRHSNAFFLCKALLMHGNLREIIAACMIERLEAGFGLSALDGVFGSPQSSILLSGTIGRLLGVPTYVLEKDRKDLTGKKMVFKNDVAIPEGATLLQVEELWTTGESALASRQAIIEAAPHEICFADKIGVFVYRPPVINRILNDGSAVIPFIEKQVDSWDPDGPDGCPLCKQGSEALEPKGENWAKLLA